MANKNNSRSPNGRFLTLRLRVIVNLTILETKKTLTTYVDNRGPDQPMLIWASVIHICKKRSWFHIF